MKNYNRTRRFNATVKRFSSEIDNAAFAIRIGTKRIRFDNSGRLGSFAYIGIIRWRDPFGMIHSQQVGETMLSRGDALNSAINARRDCIEKGQLPA